jgi:hypothetical protein
MRSNKELDMTQLREALEASWDSKTSYLAVSDKGNPALGQCYPTSWVVQFFFPKTEIAQGHVWTGKSMEKHFWNVLEIDGVQYHIDLTWQQFPHGSSVQDFKIRNREALGDSQKTVERCELLRIRVIDYLSSRKLIKLA